MKHGAPIVTEQSWSADFPAHQPTRNQILIELDGYQGELLK